MDRFHLKLRPFLAPLADLLLVTAAYLLAYALRFEGDLPPLEWANIGKTLPWVVPVKMAFFSFSIFTGACGATRASSIWPTSSRP